jgi:hypothetical protein
VADHLRTQIRDAVVTLVTGLSTTGANAFAGRPETRPLQSTELPGLLVYTADTEAEPTSGQMTTRRVSHGTELLIEAYATGIGDVDKTMDTIEKEVRVALEAAPTLAGKAKDLYFVASEKESDELAEQPTWVNRMRFRVEYDTREGVPDAALA